MKIPGVVATLPRDDPSMPAERGILIVNSVIPGVINKAKVVHRLIPLPSPVFCPGLLLLLLPLFAFLYLVASLLPSIRAARPAWPVPSINEHLLAPLNNKQE